MQEAADGSRTTGWAKEWLAAWGDRPISGERWRETDRETQEEREGGGERAGNRETERKVDPARKKEKLFKQGQSEWTDGLKGELCI